MGEIGLSIFAIYRRLLSYGTPYWPVALVVALSMVGSALLDLLQPFLIGFWVVDGVLARQNAEFLVTAVLLLAMVYVAKPIASFLEDYLKEVLSQKMIHKARRDLFTHLEALPLGFFERNYVGDLMARVTEDTKAVGDAMDTVYGIGTNSVKLVSAFALLFVIDARLTLLVLPVALSLFILVNVFKKQIRQMSRFVQAATGRLSTSVQEALSGVRTIKTLSSEEFEARKFEATSWRLAKARIHLRRKEAAYASLMDLLVVGATLAAVWFAAPAMLTAGPLTIGGFVAFLGILGKLFEPVKALSKVNFSVQKLAAAGERIFRITAEQPEQLRGPSSAKLPSLRGHIRYERVNFGYDSDRAVLRDFTLEIKPGEVVALVGRSGVGKTTVVNLLLGFYRPASGTITIDDYNLREIDLVSVRHQIGLVTQEPFLFAGTIRENIAYGRLDVTNEQIRRAAEAANAHQFIAELPKGYHTETGERGVRLSAGQRQRIAIARALVRNPSILILDEATSNVDGESELLIQDAIRRLQQGRTTIAIAHRLSTIMGAHKIVVLDHGRIVEIGTHDELLRRGGIYSRLYGAQLQTATGGNPEAA